MKKRDLGIKHDGTEDLGINHSDPEVIKRLLMILMRAMREIESSNVHPGTEELLQHRNGTRSRAESADDLSLRNTTIAGQLLEDSFNVNVRHYRSKIERRIGGLGFEDLREEWVERERNEDLSFFFFAFARWLRLICFFVFFLYSGVICV